MTDSDALIRLHESKDEFDEPPSNPIRTGLIIAFIMLLLVIVFTPSLRGN